LSPCASNAAASDVAWAAWDSYQAPSSVKRDDASRPAAESHASLSEFALARSRAAVALKSVLCWRICVAAA
jgi:hypothetical protein